jgi:hypothetical protein
MHLYVGLKRGYAACGKRVHPKNPEGRVQWTALADWVTCKNCQSSKAFTEELAENMEHALKKAATT